MKQFNIDVTIETDVIPSRLNEINLRHLILKLSNDILDDVSTAMYSGDQEINEAEAILALHRIRGRVQALKITLGSLCDE